MLRIIHIDEAMIDFMSSLDLAWPGVYLCTWPTDRVDNVVTALADSDSTWDVRVIRGRRCTSGSETLHECLAALQFPDYVGDNWDALNDSLLDLAWLPRSETCIIVSSADELLTNDRVERDLVLRMFCDLPERFADLQRKSLANGVDLKERRVILVFQVSRSVESFRAELHEALTRSRATY